MIRLLIPNCGKVGIELFTCLMAKSQEAVRVYMSSDKKRAFKAACATQGLEMSEVANKLIDEWLKANALSNKESA